MSNDFQEIRAIFAQSNFHVGDIEANKEKVIAQVANAEGKADLIIFPELALTGYPPEDLLLRESLIPRLESALDEIKRASENIYILVGHPSAANSEVMGDPLVPRLFNSASLFFKGERVGIYHKQCLPNYQVFDEKRYFVEGAKSGVFKVKGLPIALNICEDIWFDEPAEKAKKEGARAIININASPFHVGKLDKRKAILSDKSKSLGMPIFYAHCVGGQDELVFDGASMAFDAQGKLIVEAPRFEESLHGFKIAWNEKAVEVFPDQSDALPKPMSVEEEIYNALVVGVRDYVLKNRFKGVVLGLSGGIDSALTLAIAYDALGADMVEAVMMPFTYTSQMSEDDAAKQATTLGVSFKSISIETIYQGYMEALDDEFKDYKPDTTEENLQARCRGVILMAISNKKGTLVLTTGNKSEMAVGYSTLYGDMAGGFDVLKDVEKTMVFRLATYRNQIEGKEIIPQRVIDRPPSAELSPDQKDEDSLPPYDVLDQILSLYVEQDKSAEWIIDQGFEREQVYHVLRLVDINEYKRRQAPIGVRITPRGFGKDRRYPITNGWKIGR